MWKLIFSVLRVHIMDLYVWLKQAGRGEKMLLLCEAEVISESELLSFFSAALGKHKGTHRLKQTVNKRCEITH